MRFEIEDGILTEYDGSEEHVVIPDSVIRIDDNVFEGHTEIRTVVFPEGLQEIGDSAFTGCTALESIELPDSVTLIDSLAFYECCALRSVRLPRDLEEISDQVFMETDISTIELPEGLRYIGDGAFAGCKKLKSVHIPDSVEKIDVLAFGYMSNWDTDSEKIEGFELHGRLNGPARSYAHEYEQVFVPDDGDLSDLPEFEIRNGVLVSYNGSEETVVIPDTVT
nr:leucine-rich repeat domain-containing protein [Solobacterium sp.]